MTTRPSAAIHPIDVDSDPFELEVEVVDAEPDATDPGRGLGWRALAIALEPVKYAFLVVWLLGVALTFLFAQLWILALRLRTLSAGAAARPTTARPAVLAIARELPRAA